MIAVFKLEIFGLIIENKAQPTNKKGLVLLYRFLPLLVIP